MTSRRIQTFLAASRRAAAKVDDGEVHWALASDHLRPAAVRGIVGVPTLGCSYARTVWGGCAICGHSASTLWNADLSVENIIRDVERSLAELDAARPPRLCLYTSGSFLDDRELPPEAREAILAKIRGRTWVRAIAIESLPQYVTSASLARLRAAAGDVEISLGMGVDSSDTFIRSLCFQRYIPSRLYWRAVEACQTWRIWTIGYVVHHPPFLTEAEAVFDTAQSIGKLRAWGFDHVSIEPVALQAGTMQARLHAMGDYALPTFWGVASAVAAAARAAGPSLDGRLLLGGQVFTPLPTRVLQGCADCLHEAAKILGGMTGIFSEMSEVAHGITCGTPGLIEGKEIDRASIVARVEEILDRLS